MPHTYRFEKGFTIPELLVGITILGILSTIAILSYFGYTSSTRDVVRATDINNIERVLDLYNLDTGIYPNVTDPTNVLYSGATVWTQGVFGDTSIADTKKIFGELKDPKFGNPYTYSVTSSRREYQLAAYFEKDVPDTKYLSFESDLFSIPKTYASTDFNPNDLYPTIWLDAQDVNGDGNTSNNPSNGTNLSSWINKSSLGATNNPSVVNGNIRYSSNGLSGAQSGSYPGVFVANNRGLLLNNSEINNGSIFYVVQKNDPFGSTDYNGFGIRAQSSNSYYFGYNRNGGNNRRKHSIQLGSNPNISGSRYSIDEPYIFHLGVNNGNYEFYDTGTRISNGLSSSISSITWAFNGAGAGNYNSDLVISEILVFDYILTVDERQMIEGYLAHKWGQSYYLSSSHPYKSEAPEAIGSSVPDSDPDAFVIDDISNANPSQEYISNPFTVTGINTPVDIYLDRGEYSINGSSYSTSTGSVSEGDIVRIRLTSLAGSGESISSLVTIGGVSESFVVTNKVIDADIDPIAFSSITDAETSTYYVSQTQQVSGINVPVQISISGTGAEYKITDAIVQDTTGSGTASASSTHGSNNPENAFDNNLNTGWGSSSNTFPAILTYDFGVGNAKNINAYTLYRGSGQSGWNHDRYSPRSWSLQASNNGSSWTTLDTRINQQISTNASPRQFDFSNSQFYRYYRIYISSSVNSNRVNLTEVQLFNSGTGEFTNANGSVSAGDYVIVRNISSDNFTSSTLATLNIGSYSTNFEIVTKGAPPDYDPDAFSFNPVNDASPSTQYISDTINITGISANTSISISGGEYEINGSGNWSSATSSNLVAPNDSISVRGTSRSGAGETQNVILTVGSETASFVITTLVDNSPDIISFPSKTLVDVSQLIESDTVTISGINTSIPIGSVSGGEYRINNGSWSSGDSTLQENDTLTLRVLSSSSFNSTTGMTLSIAGQSYSFDVTTKEADITPDDFTFVDIIDADLSTIYISEPVTITDINTQTPISIINGEYRIGNGSFTSDAGFVNNGDTISIRLLSANQPNQTVNSEISIGGKNDYFEITTKEVIVTKPVYEEPVSQVYVGGNYNGLITHAFTGSTHYVLSSPSIISYDLSNPDFEHIVSEKKYVYKGFNNIPESYKNNNLTMSGGFDFSILNPVLYEGTKEDLGSYSGLQEVDGGVRSVFNSSFPAYGNIAKYLDTFSLNYIEEILSKNVGINPIKPYYCSDILRTKLVYNIAGSANIEVSQAESGTTSNALTDQILIPDNDENYEYVSENGNANILFSWDTSQRIGYIRLYNTISGNSSDLSDAVITFYNEFGGIIDTHNIGFDTTDDYIIDLDFESAGKIYFASKIGIESTGGKKLRLREVEIYLGGDLKSGEYKVDRDGAGGSSPYNVYCDMETEGGGWTRIGENFVTNGKFLRGNHTPEYTYQDVLNNIIVDGTTKLPPVYAADAYVMRHQGGISDFYELEFENIPGKYYAQEIRISAWVEGTDSSIFSYDIEYETLPPVSGIGDFNVSLTDGDWQYVETRIPVEDVVETFTWKLGDQIAGPIFVTDLKMEVYYK